MSRRSRPLVARAALLAAVSAGLAAPAASGYVYSDLVDFNLTETTSTYGGGTEFHVATGTDGWASYRWLDSPTKTTVVSANACGDYALYGKNTFGAGDTSYHRLFDGFAGTCFVVRGRTGAGQGAMSNRDGRLAR